MELFYGLAQGFHNAPRLYGDSTVRRPIRIQGFRSGLRAAFAEFTLGTYDAVTGVVTQPYNGAKERGAIGFVTGMGKGLGGLVLKECAAGTRGVGDEEVAEGDDEGEHAGGIGEKGEDPARAEGEGRSV